MQITSLVLFALFAIALACVVSLVSGNSRKHMAGVMSLLSALAYAPIWLRFGNRPLFANAQLDPGTHEGNITKKSDAVISSRYLLAKFGTDVDHIDLCTQATIPIGIITDEAAAIGDNVNVELLVGPQTKRVQAAAALAAGIPVYALAGGQVGTPAGSSGIAYQVGWTLTAAAAQGDIVEISPVNGAIKTF